jgi:predicted CoA-binding protein
LIEALQNKKNSIALVGASNNPKKYGNKILLDLLEKGHIVYPINKNESQIEGLKSYKKVSDLPSLPSIINFVVPPNEGIEVTKDLVKKGYDNFWYQPGAESIEISNFLESNKKNFIDDKCIMVVTRLSANY